MRVLSFSARYFAHCVLCVSIFGSFSSSAATLEPGVIAPPFLLFDTKGYARSLEYYRGKIVVLEWFNRSSPYVLKQYLGSYMQRVQLKYAQRDDVIWLTVVSSTEGERGFQRRTEADETRTEFELWSNATVLDFDGEVARLYGATHTPQIVIVDRKGRVAYNGAFDADPSRRLAKDVKPKNYVVEALESLLVERPVKVRTTKLYGCPVR